jgi:hypothetical protein
MEYFEGRARLKIPAGGSLLHGVSKGGGVTGEGILRPACRGIQAPTPPECRGLGFSARREQRPGDTVMQAALSAAPGPADCD